MGSDHKKDNGEYFQENMKLGRIMGSNLLPMQNETNPRLKYIRACFCWLGSIKSDRICVENATSSALLLGISFYWD